MRFKKFLIVTIIFFVATSLSCFSLNIKLASIAPEQSPWGKALNRLASEWERISDGKVKLIVYHNSVLGKEADMLRKMRIGQIHAGVFTSYGLLELASEVLSLSYPFLIRNDDELTYVLERVKPLLDSRIEEKNFIVLAWHKAGWIRFFSKDKVLLPQDLKSHKVAANPEDQAFFQIWEELGYQLVPVAILDRLQALNSGLINAMWSSPLAVASYQWFGIIKNMNSLKVAPFLGCIIISKSAWQRIPPHLRFKLKQAVLDTAQELDASIPAKEAEAIVIMQRYGLNINQVTLNIEQVWIEEFKRGAVLAIGKTFSRETYNLILRYLEEYRSK